jgi:hypothetical protein
MKRGRYNSFHLEIKAKNNFCVQFRFFNKKKQAKQKKSRIKNKEPSNKKTWISREFNSCPMTQELY